MAENEFIRARLRREQMPPNVRAKWSDDLLVEGFVPFPKTLLRVLTQLFPKNSEMQELAALLAVVDFKRPNLSRQPSIEYLSFISGVPVAQLDEVLRRMVAKGWINLERLDDELAVDLAGFFEAVRDAALEVA